MPSAKSVAFRAVAGLAAAARQEAEREAARVDHLMPERPKEHFCPISLDVMVDPVTAADGMTYERAAIARWLAEHNQSAVTMAVLPHKALNPNQALKSAIREWEEEEHRKCMAQAQLPLVRQSTNDLEAELRKAEN